jgi:hypothetical protein
VLYPPCVSTKKAPTRSRKTLRTAGYWGIPQYCGQPSLASPLTLYDAPMAYRRRHPRTMNDETRAELIGELRRRGWTYAQIGRRVGLSANGAKYALHKVTQPGRYDEYCEEEVDHAPPPEEW